MNKKVSIALLFAVLFVGNVANAQKETWTCSFKGTYTEKGESGGEFTWKVTWVGSGDKWLISGKTDDSETTGSCDGNTCKVDEKVLSGESKGKTYYWIGTYTDEEGKTDDTSITKFTGTWGPSASDRKSSGTWKAKATCKLKQ